MPSKKYNIKKVKSQYGCSAEIINNVAIVRFPVRMIIDFTKEPFGGNCGWTTKITNKEAYLKWFVEKLNEQSDPDTGGTYIQEMVAALCDYAADGNADDLVIDEASDAE